MNSSSFPCSESILVHLPRHGVRVCTTCAGLMAPLYFKKAVDALASQTHVAAQAAVMALLWSGGCRVINGLAKEMQHPIFTPVAQVWLLCSVLLSSHTLSDMVIVPCIITLCCQMWSYMLHIVSTCKLCFAVVTAQYVLPADSPDVACIHSSALASQSVSSQLTLLCAWTLYPLFAWTLYPHHAWALYPHLLGLSIHICLDSLSTPCLDSLSTSCLDYLPHHAWTLFHIIH